MKVVCDLMIKPIGQILLEAGLVNEGQIQVALIEQDNYRHLKLGEILVLHGWLKQKTADFFAEDIRKLIIANTHNKIENYFLKAGLLSQQDIEAILEEQRLTGVKFGYLAVLRGFVREETLEFFLRYLTKENNSGEPKFDYLIGDKTLMIDVRAI